MNALYALKDELVGRLNLVEEIQKDGNAMKREHNHWVMCCPFHSEKSASFKVKDGENRFHCYGCGADGDVLDWIAKRGGRGSPLSGVEFVNVLKAGCKRAGIAFPDKKPQKQKTIYPTLEKLKESAAWQASEGGELVVDNFEYTNPDTLALELIVFRLERGTGDDKKKRFLQAAPSGDGFAFGAPKGLLPLYNRTRVRDAVNVVLVEGEKKVKALHALGIVATSAPGGANGLLKADWSPLAGKAVTIWRDADDAGETMQETAIKQLQAVKPAPEVFCVDVDAMKLAKGEDCVDVIDRLTGSTAEKSSEIQAIITSACALGGVGALDREIEDAIAGRRYNVPWCWSNMTRQTRALIPGSVAIICGEGESTKSLALLQNLRYWHCQQWRAVALMLEDGQTFHLRRMLAQLAENSNLMDDEWCKAHPIETRSMRDTWRDEIKKMETCIEAITDPNEMTPERLLAWVQVKCDEGFRVICIDPITAMMKGQRGFDDDFRFLMGAKKIVEKARASLVLITHPRKAPAMQKGKTFDMNDLAGGTCYKNFSHAIIYLRRTERTELEVENPQQPSEKTTLIYNRKVMILKTRNGRRGNGTLHYLFDDQKLTMHELES